MQQLVIMSIYFLILHMAVLKLSQNYYYNLDLALVLISPILNCLVLNLIWKIAKCDHSQPRQGIY